MMTECRVLWREPSILSQITFFPLTRRKLSGEEEESVTSINSRLFPPDFFTSLLLKVLRALQISYKSTNVDDPDPEFPQGSDTLLSKIGNTHPGIPLPAIFYNLMKSEWENSAKLKSTPHLYFKLYSLIPDANKKTKLPSVDDPINSLSSNLFLPWMQMGSKGSQW